jgi:hypothetical protein
MPVIVTLSGSVDLGLSSLLVEFVSGESRAKSTAIGFYSSGGLTPDTFHIVVAPHEEPHKFASFFLAWDCAPATTFTGKIVSETYFEYLKSFCFPKKSTRKWLLLIIPVT